jgi:hypothetical protein
MLRFSPPPPSPNVDRIIKGKAWGIRLSSHFSTP